MEDLTVLTGVAHGGMKNANMRDEESALLEGHQGQSPNMPPGHCPRGLHFNPSKPSLWSHRHQNTILQ
jgi:hypothetical protein